MTFVGSWLVSQFGQGDALSVIGMKSAHKAAFENILPRHTENEIVGALAIEILMVNQLRNSVGIKQFNTIDEFQVGTKHRDELTS